MSQNVEGCRIWNRKCDDIDNNTLNNNIPSGRTATAVEAVEAASGRVDGTFEALYSIKCFLGKKLK